MKILFFVDRLLQGGIQTLLLNLTIELKKRDSDIIIDFLNFDDGNRYPLEDYFRNIGCAVYKVRMPKIGSFVQTIRELDDFFKAHNDYNFIHAHGSSKITIPLFYARKYKIPNRIAHSHNTKFQTRNPLLQFVGNIFKVPLSYIATDYFACGKLAGEWLFGNFFLCKKNKVKILNNGVYVYKFLYE